FIRSLEDQGLVERRLDPQDRRRFNISLTDKGRDVIRQNTRHHLETIDHCFHTLNADEMQDLIVLLQKLSVGVQALRQQAAT
ncbi:MAG: winged helix DNA-binding protein, partial [Anaerolineales bacterium]|nr:winged helix DNA-binding protein [Anaerolineales bacterium]